MCAGLKNMSLITIFDCWLLNLLQSGALIKQKAKCSPTSLTFVLFLFCLAGTLVTLLSFPASTFYRTRDSAQKLTFKEKNCWIVVFDGTSSSGGCRITLALNGTLAVDCLASKVSFVFPHSFTWSSILESKIMSFFIIFKKNLFLVPLYYSTYMNCTLTVSFPVITC